MYLIALHVYDGRNTAEVPAKTGDKRLKLRMVSPQMGSETGFYGAFPTFVVVIEDKSYGVLLTFLPLDPVNGDHLPDIVGLTLTSSGGLLDPLIGRLVVMRGDGNGGFLPQETLAEVTDFILNTLDPPRIKIADLNHDGLNDIITDARFPVLIASNTGGFNLISREHYPKLESLSDFDGDGTLDILSAGNSLNAESEWQRYRNWLQVARGDGAGGFGSPERYYFDPFASSFGVADIDMDGDTDVVVGRDSFTTLAQRNVSVLYNNSIASGAYVPGTGERRFTYDPTFSQLVRVTDELDHKMLYEVDPANGNRLSMTQVVGEVGGSDDVITTYSYTPHGLVDTTTDPLGRVTDYDYDALGRLTQVTYALGTPDQAIERYEYDTTTVAGRAGLVTAFVDANGNRTEYVYDVMNRLLRTVEPDPDGLDPLTSPVTEFEYDPAGNLIKTTDARGNVTENVYDEIDRLIRRIDSDPDGLGGPMDAPVTEFDYDEEGNLITVVDPLGHTTQHEYDARNRRIRTIDPDGGVTEFRYDLDNNLTAVIDPVGNRTSFNYDQRNRLLREVDPLGEETRYVYDPVDNLVQKTDRNGRITRYSYDDLNRLTTETWVGAAGDDNVINYAYDEASNLTSVYDAFSSLAYTYDDRNRVETVDNRRGEATQGTPGAPRVALTYQYDGVGNVLSVADSVNGSAGAATGYVYDDLDRLMTLIQAGPGLADKRVDFAYNSLGQYESINRYRDLAGTQLVVGTSYAYDALNRLDVMRHQNAASQTLNFHDLDYDTASRITRITDIDGAHDYNYDDRDQLVGANHTATGGGEIPVLADENYEYDANGNRLESHLHGTGYVTGRGNRLESDGTYNYEYDDEGNTVTRTRISGTEADGSTMREFVWDHRNRLIAVIDKLPDGTTPTQEVRFTYDALDRRIAKSVDTTPLDAVDAAFTQFVYDREDVILDFVDADGAGPAPLALDQRYLHGPAIDQVLAQDNAAGTVHWHLTDHLGTVKDLSDNLGATAYHATYDSFGRFVDESFGQIPSRYALQSREYDQELGTTYYRTRYYSPSSGRFLTVDGLGFFAGDTNLYRFLTNAPHLYLDPFGFDANDSSILPVDLSPSAQYHLNALLLTLSKDQRLISLADDPFYRTLTNYSGLGFFITPGETRNGVYGLTDWLFELLDIPGSRKEDLFCVAVATEVANAVRRSGLEGITATPIFVPSASTPGRIDPNRLHTQTLVTLPDGSNIVLDYHATLNGLSPLVLPVPPLYGVPTN